MPEFPSEAWCREAIRLLNEDPEAAAAARGWDGDFGIVIDRDGGAMGISIGAPVDGKLPEPKFLPPEQVEAAGPRYFARAKQGDWWALIGGTLDPIAAIVQKRLVARGDLTPVIARLTYRGLAERWLEQLRRGGTP
jgi:putative sterol carrier protein